MPVTREVFYIIFLFVRGGVLGNDGSMKLNKKVIFYACILFYFLPYFIVGFFFLIFSITFCPMFCNSPPFSLIPHLRILTHYRTLSPTEESELSFGIDKGLLL
jgi:hypothetical protein